MAEPEHVGPPGLKPPPGDVPAGWLSRGVASIGLASFLSDSGHEIATSLLPSFVRSVLHGSAAALGQVSASLRAGPRPFTVESNQTVRVDMEIDTGVR